MALFIGRDEQLRALDRLLGRVAADTGDKPGLAVLVRGRRRVGKSRLVEEFLARARVPSLYFTASTRTTTEELRMFAEEAASSALPGAATFADVTLGSWDAALRLLATAVPEDGPCVVVIDELPYLIASDPSFEGTLQKLFDRVLSRRRVLLIGIGSDLAMMEALNTYGRPFHQRATEMVIPPLGPAEVATMLGLEPAEAFDAYLITGGLPLVCAEWPSGMSMWDYLRDAVNDSTSALVVSGERALAAEFPPAAQARLVLSTIGAGETTFANIGRKAGDLRQASLNRSLTLLKDKRIVAGDQPLSTKAPADSRYRVADPYLRFWLPFVGSHISQIERGRGDLVLQRIRTSWTSWRGRAIEPVVRESLDRLSPTLFDGGVVGSYWTRSNDPEIDLVVADRGPVANVIIAAGSIKWLENKPFDAGDLAQLTTQRSQLPGASDTTPLVVVSRTGATVSGVTVLTPSDLLDGWQRHRA